MNDDTALDAPAGPDTLADGDADPGAAVGDGGPVARRARRRRRRLVRRHPVLTALAGALALLVAVAAVGVVWALGQIDPGGRPGRTVTVTIPEGVSTARIAALLARAGVIHDADLFRVYAKLEGTGPLLAGTYRLATNEPYRRVIRDLEGGAAPVVDRLVVPEGFTLREIAERVATLPGMHISAASFLAVSSSGAVRSPYEPHGVDDLEGLVFPATYDISRQDTAADILAEMVAAFDQRAAAIGLAAGAARLHLSVYQLVEVASIVQGEAKLAGQFPDVASVLYNRLREGIPLGADSTLIYALRQRDPDVNPATVDYDQPNPYNTRLHAGLPPTPIDSPGLVALDAALHPPATDLLYFVEVNRDGRLGFASTSAGFEELQRDCDAAGLC